MRPATVRRFTFKMEFDYLTDEGKTEFLNACSPVSAPHA